MKITITLSKDGYGPEAESEGKVYIDALHDTYCSFIERRVGEDLAGSTVYIETGLETKIECDQELDLDLQSYWNEWCERDENWTAFGQRVERVRAAGRAWAEGEAEALVEENAHLLDEPWKATDARALLEEDDECALEDIGVAAAAARWEELREKRDALAEELEAVS